MQKNLSPFKGHFPNFLECSYIKAVSLLQDTSSIIIHFCVPWCWFCSGDLKSCHYFHWHETHVFMFPPSPLYGVSDDGWNTFNETVDDETLYNIICVEGQRAFLALTPSSYLSNAFQWFIFSLITQLCSVSI